MQISALLKRCSNAPASGLAQICPKAENMHHSRRLDIDHPERINRQLATFIRRLVAKFRTRKVYLFGSFARGEQSEASDIDLLIVGEFKGNFLDRYPDVRRLSSLPIEPFCYTPQEIEQMKKNENPLIKNMLKGRLLYSS